MGFKKSDGNVSLLTRLVDLGTVILCVYINDMFVIGDKAAVEAFKKEIKMLFNTKEEETLDEYVGYKITINGDKLHIFQPNIMYNIKKEHRVDVKDICKYQTPVAPGFTVRRPVRGEIDFSRYTKILLNGS